MEGLSSHEANQRLKKYGLNILVESKKKNIIHHFLIKFLNPLISLLLLASFLSAFTGEIANFFIIFFIIFISICIDFYQEHTSEKAAEKLKQKVAIKALVLRDGERKEIFASYLTVGDIFFLTAGDLVPADAKILSTKDLHVDQSILTGESYPVEKNRHDQVLMGTMVVNGEAIAEVEKIGKETQLGKISDKLSLQREKTDFEIGIENFGLLVLKVTLALVAFIFLINILVHKDFFSSMLFALALAVGLTPELLPMIVAVNLAKSAVDLAKQGVIVKHLPAIQNLGGIEILCTDKTGTITENKIELERYENIYQQEDRQVLHFAYLNSFFQSNPKNPLDEAILKHKEMSAEGYQKIDEIPFDFERKRLSVIVKKNNQSLLISKGSAQTMFSICTHYQAGTIGKISQAVKLKLESRYRELSEKGFRVLIVAYKSVDKNKKIFSKADEKDLIFAGFTAFLDPPKKSAIEVINSLREKKVDLKILTGDNEMVTQKICQELGIKVSGVLIGKDIELMDDKQLFDMAKKANIFARLVPDTKQRIITVLRKGRLTIGYLGDGVNDATSLKAADVGISVDNAVDVAREAADIILVRKSLHVLSTGIIEGRKTFINTLKYIFIGMGSNFGNMLSVSVSSLFLPFLPMLPTQILLNNLIYDLTQITLPTDNVDKEELIVNKKWDINFIKKFMLTFGPISSIFDLITFFSMLFIFKSSVAFFRSGWFIESIFTQSLIIFAFRTRKVPFFKSRPSIYLFLTVLTGVFFGIFISQSFLGRFFQFVPLPLNFWLFLAGIVGAYFLMVELAKLIFYRQIFKERK